MKSLFTISQAFNWWFEVETDSIAEQNSFVSFEVFFEMHKCPKLAALVFKPNLIFLYSQHCMHSTHRHVIQNDMILPSSPNFQIDFLALQNINTMHQMRVTRCNLFKLKPPFWIDRLRSQMQIGSIEVVFRREDSFANLALKFLQVIRPNISIAANEHFIIHPHAKTLKMNVSTTSRTTTRRNDRINFIFFIGKAYLAISWSQI